MTLTTSTMEKTETTVRMTDPKSGRSRLRSTVVTLTTQLGTVTTTTNYRYDQFGRLVARLEHVAYSSPIIGERGGYF